MDFLSKKQDSIEVSEPSNELIKKSTPPVPPGLEEESEKVLNYAKSWDELPPGGQYTDTVPMRYEGEDCGIWVQMDDESWVKNIYTAINYRHSFVQKSIFKVLEPPELSIKDFYFLRHWFPDGLFGLYIFSDDKYFNMFYLRSI